MIEVKNLTKRFGDKTAVDNISFTLKDGVLGFLGPNGAGKTTTMNMLTGYLSSTGGTVTVDGAEILREPRRVKAQIGYLPEQPPLYQDMTVKEYLSFVWQLKKLKGNRRERIAEICTLVGVGDVYHRMLRNLSKGYRQRVGLAQALLGDPRILILDEPTSGLDPKQIIEIRRLIRDLGKKHTVILSSHILSEVQAVCDRIIVISQGRLVADDTPQNLSASLSPKSRFTARIAGPEKSVLPVLRGVPGIGGVESLGAREKDAVDYRLTAKGGADPRRELFFRLAEHRWPLLELRLSELSLEDVFLQLTEDPEQPEKGGDA